MWDLLARILSNGGDKPWLSQHPNAQQQRKQRIEGGFVVTFRDSHSGEEAVYQTDELGNVLHVDVLR
jgi:hypothetical protein